MGSFPEYLHAILRVNSVENSRDIEWLFHCGMLFSSPDKWWGDFSSRHSAHEGVDISYYRRHKGQFCRFDTHIVIPAMEAGILLQISDDFLGRTLVVEHEVPPLHTKESKNSTVLFIYSHITPLPHLKAGQTIQKHEIIGNICPRDKNPLLPPHLHFSCCEIPEKARPVTYNWDYFSTDPDVNFIHPFFL